MPSVWIRTRETGQGRRFDVRFRAGGREAPVRHGGTFKKLREAKLRRDAIAGELASLRVPDLRLDRMAPTSPTLAEAAAAWQASRIDVSESTRVVHGVALKRVIEILGDSRVDEVSAGDVAGAIATIAETRKRGSVQKSLTYLRLVLDHAGIEPNPARDRRVKLPREVRPEINPPTASQVEAVLRTCAPKYRLPLIVLDATGMRVGELESLRWGDIDVPEGQWRVTRDRSKTRRPRWVQVPADVFAAVLEQVPPEDRDAASAVFPGVTQARLRTDIQRACRASQTPLWSPHDLRHRRISLWHRDGIDWANIGKRVGQRNISVTADTYTHVILEAEVDYSPFLVRHG